MALAERPVPVKLFAAILWADAFILDRSIQQMRDQWGDIDYIGMDRVFNTTNYYLNEMGSFIQRRIISFKKLVQPDQLSAAKTICNNIENNNMINNHRKVNLDVGYLDHNKVLLASVKYAGQKIYLDQGVYADMILRYRKGFYEPFEWTFPDFKDNRYYDELISIRETYLQQLREGRISQSV